MGRQYEGDEVMSISGVPDVHSSFAQRHAIHTHLFHYVWEIQFHLLSLATLTENSLSTFSFRPPMRSKSKLSYLSFSLSS